MKTVFIAHQIAGDVEANLESVKAWVKWAIFSRKVIPVVPYLYLCQILDENLQSERALGVILCMEAISTADEFWICGPHPREDSQVWREVEEARKHNIPIIDYSGLKL